MFWCIRKFPWIISDFGMFVCENQVVKHGNNVHCSTLELASVSIIWWSNSCGLTLVHDMILNLFIYPKEGKTDIDFVHFIRRGGIALKDYLYANNFKVEYSRYCFWSEHRSKSDLGCFDCCTTTVGLERRYINVL